MSDVGHGTTPLAVRVRDTAKSTLRGQTLTVVRTEKRQKGSTKVAYLCEMPGWPYPGWFDETEVERV